MSVYQKDGKWYFEAMIRGKRYHRAVSEANTKKEAEMYFCAFKTDLLRGRLDMVENIGIMPFKKLANKYIEYSKANHRSWQTNVAKAEKFKERWGNKQIKDISPMDIEKYRSERKKDIVAQAKIVDGKKVPTKYVSATTINRDVEVLRKMFSIAVDNGWLIKNPCASIKKLRQENKLERYLGLDEEQRLYMACDGNFDFITDEEKRKKTQSFYKNHFSYMKQIIICALHTGMRKEEILGLQWRCVDLKGQKITLLDTKNGKVRKVPINSVLKRELEKLKKNKLSEYVFTNPVTETRYSDLKRTFNSLCKVAMVNEFRFHDLRHSSATRMVAAGVDIITVKEILGHSDIHTTMRYAHAITEQKLSAVETLANFGQNLTTKIKAVK